MSGYAKGAEAHDVITEPTPEQMRQLWDVAVGFIKKVEIICPESVCQTDRVIEGAYDFIGNVCDVVGYHEFGKYED